MANSRYYQFLYSKTAMLTQISGAFAISGTGGAVGSITGAGVFGVTKLATGIYQVQLVENFNYLVSAALNIEAPPSGTPVAAGAFATGTLYQITTVGTTNWTAIGLAAGLTAAVGQTFVATGAGSGTGVAQAIVSPGVVACQVAENPEVMLQNSVIGQGAVINVRVVDASLALANPAAGTVIRLAIMLRNSSVTF